MNNDTNSEVALIAVLTIDIASSAGMYLAKHLTPEQLRYWQGRKKEMHKALRATFQIPDDQFTQIRDDWQAFYQKRYNWVVDFSQVAIPQQPSASYRLLIVAKGLICDKVYGAWPFPKWKYLDMLDVAVPKNIRTSTNGHYAVWVLDGVEPDAEFLGKSTQVADPEMKVGLTLLERILLEDKYFDETGKHLDVIGGTLCGGSRGSGGGVPYVRLGHFGKVDVSWLGLSDSDPCYGARRAVST